MLGPVNRRDNWKTWERRGEKLDYQSLITTPNNLSALHLINTISDTSKNQTKRLDSNNQINLSSLIDTLDIVTPAPDTRGGGGAERERGGGRGVTCSESDLRRHLLALLVQIRLLYCILG